MAWHLRQTAGYSRAFGDDKPVTYGTYTLVDYIVGDQQQIDVGSAVDIWCCNITPRGSIVVFKQRGIDAMFLSLLL